MEDMSQWAAESTELARRERSTWTPDVEIFQRGAELVVRADFPGLNKDDIAVEITDSQVVLKGERKEEKEEEKEGYSRAQRSYRGFYRTLPLPEGAKADGAKATMRNGVLEITVPIMKPAEKKRRLDIQEPAAPEKPAKHAA